jgi:hypothetical protein
MELPEMNGDTHHLLTLKGAAHSSPDTNGREPQFGNPEIERPNNAALSATEKSDH